MKIQVKSGEIPVCKNVVKIMQNLGCHRPQSPKLTFSQYSKFNHNNQGKRFKDIKKVGLIVMAERRVLVQVKEIYRPCGWWEHLISNSLDAGQVGCRTWDTAHINDCIDACKCTEIFRNNLLQRVYNEWESKWLKVCTKANQTAHQI